MHKQNLILFILLLLLSSNLAAQTPEEVADSMPITGFENLKIPPVSVFLESAYRHPSTEIYATYSEEENEKLKIEKRKWMNYFRAVGNYQYGHNNAYIEGTGGASPGNYFNGERKSYFNVGLSIYVPIGDLVNQKSTVAVQRAKVKRVEYEYEIALEERKLQILTAYNKLLQLMTVLRSKADAAALYNAQMSISEEDFINGKISIIELSLERARRSTAVVSYEDGRTELQSAIMLLEMLTGVTIIK